jgi:tetratricopeptide (TPR) repeat protein
VSQPSPALSVEERREKHRIFLRDTIALATLSCLVVVFSFVTHFLSSSFAHHRQMLEQRWRVRGEAALAAGNPVAALASLHSALAYAPDDRGLQIELARALAAAGHIREAQTYFNTLLEAEPGSGIINLELARLAVRQNNVQAAIDDYQAAIDGTWNGDAYTRRRQIRLELSKYLIQQGRLPEARNQLLVTAGNAPDDAALQLQVGHLLVDAQDLTDALDVFHRGSRGRSQRLAALEAEGQTAALLGRFNVTHTLLARAVAEPEFQKQPPAQREVIRTALQLSQAALALYPSDTLTARERAQRVARDAALVQQRLSACAASTPTPPAAPAVTPQPLTASAPKPELLAGLAQHLKRLNPLGPKPASAATPSAPAALSLTAPNPAASPLSVLAARWTAMPTGAALVQQLLADPGFEQNTIQLIYSTARATPASCSPATTDQTALARIAQAPDQVEAQP